MASRITLRRPAQTSQLEVTAGCRGGFLRLRSSVVFAASKFEVLVVITGNEDRLVGEFDLHGPGYLHQVPCIEGSDGRKPKRLRRAAGRGITLAAMALGRQWPLSLRSVALQQ